ncbi:MAG: DinB family protein [Cyclobacteriaceae bacterium]|nr:DinB family protein [Cyclobacteriaceae bacterium]
MDPEYIIDQLEENQKSFKALLGNVSMDLINWKPGPEKWSLLEIVCHLYDEERDDFRTRVKSVLEHPRKQFPKFDTHRWVIDHEYSKQDYYHKLLSFLAEREESVNWLRSLEVPNWQNVHVHPTLGKMSAELLLNNWLAHDYHHIRQINNNKYLFLKEHVKTSLRYAGEW